ncbi:MAG: hypothetical protein ACUVWN_00275 [bacterium]
MKKFIIILLSFLFCIGLMIYSTEAADDPATCKALVDKVKAAGGHNHPEYYTGKHGFMNETDIVGQGTPKKGLYVMSWLVLDPPLKLGAGGGAASIGKDLYKEYFGIAELDVTKSAANYPYAGMKSIKPNSKGETMYWMPINFLDLVDAKQGNLFNSGNQFDWAEWGALDQFHEYLFCLVKWNKAGEITVKVGSDDPEITWVNGAKVCEGLADRDYTPDQDSGKFTVKAGEWNAIFVEVGENGGECGFTMRLEPPPDDHTLNTTSLTAINSSGKISVTWGAIKGIY